VLVLSSVTSRSRVCVDRLGRDGRVKRLAAIVGLLLILPSVASADSFSATFAGTGLGTGVQGSVNGSAFSVWAGQIKWDVGLGDLLTTFCVDLKSALTHTQEFESEIPSDINSDSARKMHSWSLRISRTSQHLGRVPDCSSRSGRSSTTVIFR
jgi:hypothetical protein